MRRLNFGETFLMRILWCSLAPQTALSHPLNWSLVDHGMEVDVGYLLRSREKMLDDLLQDPSSAWKCQKWVEELTAHLMEQSSFSPGTF